MQVTEKKDITLPLHNREALQQLEQELEAFSKLYAGLSAAAIIAGACCAPAFVLFGLAYPALYRIEKLARLIKVMRLLLEEFEHLGVQIFPTLEMPKQDNPLDLLVRFPKKAHILISIRSKGESQIVYNEAKEALYVKRDNKGIKDWKPCPLVELADYTNWLTKNRELFGMSSREVRNVPLAKVLVLWKPTLLHNHRKELYTTIESFKILILKRKGTVFLIPEEDIVKFIKGFLARYETKEA